MNKLFSKVLLGLVAILFALSLFSFLVIKVSNQVRYEHYWTEVFTPPLQFLADHPVALATIQSQSVSVTPFENASLSDIHLARLLSGQVLIEDSADGISAWKVMDEQNLLMQMEVRLDGDELYQLYVQLLQFSLAFLDHDEISLNTLESTFEVELELIDSEEGHSLSTEILEALVKSGFDVSRDGGTVLAYIRAVSGEIYKVEFPSTFSSFSLPVALFLFGLSVACLGMMVKATLRTLDRQLRSIETVTSRIARGELDARVKRASGADALGRLGTSFNGMAEHIQRLMMVQKEMIHAVSHELRTPVARIRFGVQMIEDCEGKDDLRKQLKGIDGDIQELDELIDEILTYARLEQGGPVLAFHEANVMEIVDQVVQEQSSVKPEMTIEAEYKTESELWKDSEVEARYIHRSIQNLVGNATRYAKSRVKVVCSFDKETCRVDVEDDGPGIPEENWESVFTPFSRLDDSRTRSSGGYGLGLSIVRRILYWHGGQAFLGRSDMGGAKFSLVWPRKQQAPS